MILPYFNGFSRLKNAPMTYLILFFNILVFISFHVQQEKGNLDLSEYYADEEFLSTQGQVFAQLILSNPEEYSNFYLRLADLAQSGNEVQEFLLGQLALRNDHFRNIAIDLPSRGDKIAFHSWQKKFLELQEIEKKHPIYFFGLSSMKHSLVQWFGYQFFHGSFLHLISNMWYLILLGCVLEPLIGTASFLLVYIGGGVVSAFFYFFLSGFAPVPLVGASGAISALMGLFVVLWWDKKTQFLYWLLPMKDYMGFRSFPVWLALLMWLLSDLAGYFSSIQELGGIAHSAHLGGIVAGFSLGVFLRFIPRIQHAVKNSAEHQSLV